MIRNAIVLIQMMTYVGLALLFWKGGQHRLAVAQALYFVACGFLFLGVK